MVSINEKCKDIILEWKSMCDNEFLIQKEEEFYTFEVYYTDLIVRELDMEINQFVKNYLKYNFQISSEWYYSEFTTTDPTYRLIGYELDRELTELERFELIDALILEFDGFVKPQ
jgi:hypothetical protein